MGVLHVAIVFVFVVLRYRLALQDTRQVLSMPKEAVGTQNWILCNQMQHRLNRVIQQLRAGSY